MALSNVHPFVCPTLVNIVSKWLNVESRKQCYTKAHDFLAFDTKDLGETGMRSPPVRAPNGIGKMGDFRFISRCISDGER